MIVILILWVKYLLSKENSNQLDNEKTFQIIKNNMRQRTQIEISKINSSNNKKRTRVSI